MIDEWDELLNELECKYGSDIANQVSELIDLGALSTIIEHIKEKS